ncbi:hypothetical protein DC522_22930 [Microvirga sp. KLBC 81]|uniref:hypothetical protein n=1 Tax=Microvirga sp. KLBC 81 TaxID=1862707 RepID=UPI000D50C613|nr:hypothetical protein [Microvirga sp. KLBC 81]PVE22088.1 hypothetical protein DC522_22930 [Microvirga sp. KLBC 81]
MIGRVQERIRSLLQQTASRLAEVARLPVGIEDTEVTRGADQPSNPQAQHRPGKPSSPPYISSKEPESATDMSASVDTLAEQMLTLVDIVSAQEKDIKALKEQCRKLEEHNQAIMVAFSAFFHVLSVGRVAKATDIAALLQNISKIAEQEGRPKESVAFLQDLARMVPGHADSETGT